MLTAVTVVVPAHDEAELLPGCLAALDAAARAVPVEVRVIVVADACTDDTAAIARAAGATVLEVDHRTVGASRAAGFAWALAHSPVPERELWLATTDADSHVPAHWLDAHLAAGRRADVVAGTVEVTDWTAWPSWFPALYRQQYGTGTSHVHGANLGFTATAYRAVDGFLALACGEDEAIVNVMRHNGFRIEYLVDAPVRTSARHSPRCEGGFGTYLATLLDSETVAPEST